MNQDGQAVLYAIVTGSPASRDVGKLVDLAQTDGWDVCVIASP
ncbi:MAG: flavoprotein, partial [Actinobacteria bacterium]|nr:flavoprotein [Actinomycetota bacterium]